VIRTATPEDLPSLRTLFARSNEEPYDLAVVAEEKCFGEGVAGAPMVRVFGAREGAAITCGKHVRLLIVDRDSRRRGVGSALLADAESRGARVIAAEPGNYFTPGVSDSATQAFVRARGYTEKASTWNLEASLRAGESRRVVESSSRRGEDVVSGHSKTRRLDDSTTLSKFSATAAEDAAPRRPSHAEGSRVLAFIEREFGRIWRFEAAKAFDTGLPQIFITEDAGDVTGFAAHDVNNRGLGFFGPTGVANAMRGRGLGCALLRSSLADLRRLGFDRAVIPWTDALPFYDKCCGAKPAHRFIAFEKAQP